MSNPFKIKVELDVAFDDSLDQVLNDLVEAGNGKIDAVVVDQHGPGGGWPVVTFEGAVTDMWSMLVAYAGEDQEQAWDHLTTAKAVEFER